MPTVLTNRQTLVKGAESYFCLPVHSVSLSDGFSLPIMPMPNRIAELRKAKDVTIEELAERTGISVSYLSRMATGGRNVSLKNLSKIAEALNVLPSDLLPDGQAPDQVPVVGYVGAGAENHYYSFADAPEDWVPMPPGGETRRPSPSRSEATAWAQSSTPGSCTTTTGTTRPVRSCCGNSASSASLTAGCW